MPIEAFAIFPSKFPMFALTSGGSLTQAQHCAGLDGRYPSPYNSTTKRFAAKADFSSNQNLLICLVYLKPWSVVFSPLSVQSAQRCSLVWLSHSSPVAGFYCKAPFSAAGHAIWNDVPVVLRLISRTHAFFPNVKTFICGPTRASSGTLLSSWRCTVKFLKIMNGKFKTSM